MKNILNKIALIFVAGCTLLLGGIFSCTDLDEVVYDQIPSDEYLKTEAQINSIIGPVYKSLKSFWPGDMFCVIEEAGDMAVTPTRSGGDWWDGGFHMEMGLRTWTARNNLIRNCWNQITSGITRANQVISILENAEMDAATRTQVIAEIRGVRAFWYYVLIDMFGNGPLTSDFKPEVPGMSSRKELYTFVVSELNAIKDVVRSQINSSSYGKFTKGAAYTLLAKMYLNAQVWTGEPLTATAPGTLGQAKWQEVIDACDVVMGMSYIIEPNWKTSFSVNNQTSQEIIFPITFGRSDGGNHLHYRTLHYLTPPALGMNLGTWNGICAAPDYVKQFDVEDQRFEGSFMMGPIINPATGTVFITAHGRPLIHSIDLTKIPGTEKSDARWSEVNQEDGARVNKWEYERGLSSSEQENDFAIFRLADVYLMKAEALTRLGTNNAEATRLVNVIRERGFGNPSKNYTSVTLDDIYLERRLELAWENYSRQDRIRFGTFDESGFDWRPGNTEPYLRLFPIPYEAYQTNNKLVQNPVYPAFSN